MKPITIQEFCKQPLIYLEGTQSLQIEHEGKVIGIYYPQKSRKSQEFESQVRQLGQLVQQALLETGMTEDEFANCFDLNQPFPLEKTI